MLYDDKDPGWTNDTLVTICKKKNKRSCNSGCMRWKHKEIPEDTIQNMGIHGSITGKMMTRIICFDHITTDTTPLPNL